jgi:hypothetical protein
MPTERLPLDIGGPERLEITWDHVGSALRVLLDGKEVGAITGKSSVRKGGNFELPDGSTLSVSLAGGLKVFRNGQRLPESMASLIQKLQLCVSCTIGVGSATLAAGLVSLFTNGKLGVAPSITFGLVMVALGLVVLAKRSRWALGAAVAVLCVVLVNSLPILISLTNGDTIVYFGGVWLMGLVCLGGMSMGFAIIPKIRVAEEAAARRQG